MELAAPHRLWAALDRLDTHMPALLAELTPNGPVYLTGGAKGAEGSIVGTVVLLSEIAFNVWRAKGRGNAATELVHI